MTTGDERLSRPEASQPGSSRRRNARRLPNAGGDGAIVRGTRVTMRDVAREAGVSVATVSNWLNNRQSQIAPSTAETVASVAARLGYRPFAPAQGLRTSRTHSLGLVIPSLDTLSMADVVRGAEETASKLGFSLLLSNIDRHWDRALEHGLTMAARGVGGVAFAFVSGDGDDGLSIAEIGLPTATLIPDASQVGERTILLNNAAACRQIASHLWNLGHRLIGFTATSLSTSNATFRLRHLRQSFTALGGELTDEHVHIDHISAAEYLDHQREIQAGRTAALRLLSLPTPPTAICAADDVLAVGVLWGARDLGMRVPDDLSVVGFDDLVLAQITEPTLTTVAVDRRRLGTELIAALVDETGAERPAVHPTLVRRQSSGRAP